MSAARGSLPAILLTAADDGVGAGHGHPAPRRPAHLGSQPPHPLERRPAARVARLDVDEVGGRGRRQLGCCAMQAGRTAVLGPRCPSHHRPPPLLNRAVHAQGQPRCGVVDGGSRGQRRPGDHLVRRWLRSVLVTWWRSGAGPQSQGGLCAHALLGLSAGPLTGGDALSAHQRPRTGRAAAAVTWGPMATLYGTLRTAAPRSKGTEPVICLAGDGRLVS